MQTDDKALPRLRGLTFEECEQLARDAGVEPYRGRQLFQFLQRKGARSLDEMMNLGKPFRTWLAENTRLGGIAEIAAVKESRDGSFKFLFVLDDGKRVESVLMPDPKRNYWTLCISSQVGCAVDCKFCVTGFNGFFRHMRPDEIVDEVLTARRYLRERQPDANFRNVVFMGMGEPLLNADATIRAIRIITHNEGVDLSPRRVTVSTSGIVPGMVQLAESGVGACLAVSLNGSSAEQREKLMPIQKKYPLEDVLDVTRRYKFGKNRRVTFEYVMLSGVNDTAEDARRVAKLLKGIECKVNLIPFNPSPLLPFGRPEEEAIERFGQILSDQYYTVSVRWSKALDVDGACGQLAGDQKRKRAAAPAAQARAAEAFPEDLDFFATVAATDDEDEEA